MALASGLAAGVLVTEAHAIRPFVTDDARVVGEGQAQLESWALLDREAFQHNALAALGPTPWLEVTAGAIHGTVHTGPERGYSLFGPIVQAKALLHPAQNNGWPGVAIAMGVLAPWGIGSFTPSGWSTFGYLALTESLWNERVLVHGNIGLAALADPAAPHLNWVAGVGTQVRLLAGLHAVAEIYHGDPFNARFTVGATQAGFRYIFSEYVQIDATVGTSLAPGPVPSPGEANETLQWGTLGLRLVTPRLWGRDRERVSSPDGAEGHADDRTGPRVPAGRGPNGFAPGGGGAVR